MKKVFVLLSGLAFMMVLGFTSCGKNYTCTCTFTPPTPSASFEIDNSTLSNAQSTCNTDQKTYRTGDPNATCTLN